MSPLSTPFRPLLRPRPLLLTSSVPSPFMSLPLAVGAAVVGVGAYYSFFSSKASGDASNMSSKTTATSGGQPGFGFPIPRSLKVASTEMVNHNTKKIRFELPDPSKSCGLSLTSAVLTFNFPGGGWLPAPRPYTPTNDLNEPGVLELTVKHYPGGKGSTNLHSLKVGDTLSMMPLPKAAGFQWTPNKHAHVALIAGGAGITPMYQLSRGILENPSDGTTISLVWGVNGDEDIFFKDEFSALERKFPGRFKATYVVSHPEPNSPYKKGYVTKELLESAGLSAKSEKNRDTKVFICGPPAFEKAVANARGFGPMAKVGGGVLGELGYQPAQIHKF